MSDIFFTADSHFYHSNIIRHCHRPWLRAGDLDEQGNWAGEEIAVQRTEEMNEDLIKNWNEVVSPGDIVYHCGDFAFARALAGREAVKKIIRRLNSYKNIQLILGNHDKKNLINKFKDFAWVGDTKCINVEGQMIFLSHYAHRVWDQSHRGSWNLVGHSHNNLTVARPDSVEGGLLLDVGVDVWDYKPISFDFVRGIMNTKKETMKQLGLMPHITGN